MSMLVGDQILEFREKMLLSGLKAELAGFKLTAKANCYAIIKKEFGLKGNKQSVYDQFKEMLITQGKLPRA